MSSDLSRNGLSRDVPEAVARAVRQRCGFGCIACGCAIIQYHHFDPEFADATEHRTEGITLLCGTCHDKTEKGLLDLGDIRRLDADPFCKRAGFVGDVLFLSAASEPQFRIGSATFRRPVVVAYDGVPVLWFDGPEKTGGPVRLYAELHDYDSEHLLTIRGNEWHVGTHHFDIQTLGSALVVRKRLGNITLRMVREEGGYLALERLKMCHRGFKVSVETKGLFTVQNPAGGKLRLVCPNIYSTLRLFGNGGAAI